MLKQFSEKPLNEVHWIFKTGFKVAVRGKCVRTTKKNGAKGKDRCENAGNIKHLFLMGCKNVVVGQAEIGDEDVMLAAANQVSC